MTEGPTREVSAARERMVAAAAALFARSGFHGVTTRDIAHSASVSEGNLFRYFPSKRELFMAAIDYELGKLRVRTEVLGEGAGLHTNTEDSRAALRRLFEAIAATVVKEPDLVRLLHFSALEFGAEMGPLYRKHLDGILASSARNLEEWSRNYGFRNLSARVTVLSFVATVVLAQLYPVVSGSELPFASVESAAAEYAELWYRVLCDEPATQVDNHAGFPASALGN